MPLVFEGLESRLANETLQSVLEIGVACLEINLDVSAHFLRATLPFGLASLAF